MEGFLRWMKIELPGIDYISPSANTSTNQNVPSSIINQIGSGEVRMIFVPINHSNNHWTLLVLDLVNRSYFHYDPMIGSGNVDITINRIIDSVENFVGGRFRNLGSTIIFPRPQASNWECGYLCLLMSFFQANSLSLPKEFSIEMVSNLRNFLHSAIIGEENKRFNPFGASEPSNQTVLGSSGKPLGPANDSASVNMLVKVIFF